MILLELEINDFKQYRGRHIFAPAETGVVAIIGPNGAGKTTLFEAIEWALYQPRDIRAADIPPRGLTESAQPSVRLRIASTRSPEVYEIERRLRRGTASVEVRRLVDGVPEVVATGSAAVQTYVAGTLIGMEHRAFVATFFTRQKELSFFGTMAPTERRREVGRLLGLETIRKAQELIAEDRRAQKAKAEGLKAIVVQESQERDFTAERLAHQDERVVIQREVDRLSEEISSASQAFQKAERARDEVHRINSARQALMTDLEAKRGTVRAADQAIVTARAELDRIDQQEALLGDLTIEAEAESGAAERVATLERVRTAFEERRTAQRRVDEANAQLDSIASRAAQAVDSLTGTRFSIGVGSPIGERLANAITATKNIDVDATEQRLNRMLRLIETQEAVTRSGETLATMRRLLETLQTELDTRKKQFADQAGLVEVEDQILTAERERSTHQASIGELEKVSRIYESFAGLDVRAAGDVACPTCGRPIQEHEREGTRAHVTQVVAANRTSIGVLQRDIVRIDQELINLRNRKGNIAAAQDEVAKLQGRIEVGASKIETQEAEHVRLENNLTAIMVALSVEAPPTAADVAAIRAERDEQRQASQGHARLVELEQMLATATAAQGAASVALAGLPVVTFTEAELTDARQQLDRAKAAGQRIAEITKQVLRRAEHDGTIQRANTERTEALAKVTTLQGEIDLLVFEPDALEKAEAAVREARVAERRATAGREAERSRGVVIENALKQIDLDERRIADRMRQADEAKVQADELDRMYAEFNSFEQYVSRRVRPQLEELTSDLVRTITEGKYDTVAMDDDYGITVADGEYGYFPVTEFSGGERDVISLAARLALSQLIGSQAVNPPSFLVLDEVFGSLDRDRRASVLELLNLLAGTAEAFRQLFVISHIDDVRLSPSFTEVWRVVEDSAGFSMLENMGLTDGIEDV